MQDFFHLDFYVFCRRFALQLLQSSIPKELRQQGIDSFAAYIAKCEETLGGELELKMFGVEQRRFRV